MILVPCLGSRADKGPSGLHTLGLWNSSEETQDKEFYSETGWGSWREKEQRDRTRRDRAMENRDRRRWRKCMGRSEEVDRGKDAEIDSEAETQEPRETDREGQRDRQTLTQEHEGHASPTFILPGPLQ